jgi:hypothetical protein
VALASTAVASAALSPCRQYQWWILALREVSVLLGVSGLCSGWRVDESYKWEGAFFYVLNGFTCHAIWALHRPSTGGKHSSHNMAHRTSRRHLPQLHCGQIKARGNKSDGSVTPPHRVLANSTSLAANVWPRRQRKEHDTGSPQPALWKHQGL